MKGKSSFLSAALIACLVAGCGAGSGNRNDMERPQKGEVVGGAGGQVGDLTVAEEVEVDLAAGNAAVVSDAVLPLDEVRNAVDEAGYQLAGVDA